MTHSSWLPLKVDSRTHKEGRKLVRQKKPTVCYHLRVLHWLDEVFKQFPKPVCSRSDALSSHQKGEEEAGHAPSPFAAEVHPACGTLKSGYLSKSEKFRESHPYMEVNSSGPSFSIGCLLCAFYIMWILQQCCPHLCDFWEQERDGDCPLPEYLCQDHWVSPRLPLTQHEAPKEKGAYGEGWICSVLVLKSWEMGEVLV